MKLTTRILSLLVLSGLVVFFAGCDKENNKKKSQAEKQFDKLKSSWSLTSANDGTDRTSDFPSLVLSVSGTFAEDGEYNYAFTGTRPNPSPWPADGTWKFGSDPASDIIRDPETDYELPMTYTVSETTLEINFTIPDGDPGFPGGRVNSVSGDWTFVFTKQ
jgi:hypothetical protein